MNETRIGTTGEQANNSAGREPPKSSRRHRRLERIRDYECDALAQPDALVANLGAINSDLMRLAYRLLRSTNAGLAQYATSLEDVATILPAIGVCSQITRQIDRLAQLDCRLRVSPSGNSPPGFPARSRNVSTGRQSEENRS
jgi:hypothetical protein